MRIRATVAAAAFLGSVSVALLTPREAAAQSGIQPDAKRDENWGTVSNITMAVGATTVFLMPRVYYSDPEATVGWKGRWHFSALAPAMTLTVATLFIDTPIRNAVESPRPGCTVGETRIAYQDSGCESFGGPSTQAFASWSATGAGHGIFLVDTLKYSDGRFSVPAFIGNFAVPLTASIITSIGRSVEPGDALAYEDVGQNFAGLLPGFFSGLLVGIAYGMWQPPNCGYGDKIFCW
jgi:hypothetical protein